MKTKNAQQSNEAVPQIDTSFLLSKVDQTASVRSTFTLTPEADKILTALSEQANITQREVFDQAVSNGWLKPLAQQIKENPPTEARTERRTLVLSGKALEELDKAAKEYSIKRDELASVVMVKMLSSHNFQIEYANIVWGGIMDFANQVSREIFGVYYKIAESSLVPIQYRDIAEAMMGRVIDEMEGKFSDQWTDDEEFDCMMEDSWHDHAYDRAQQIKALRKIAKNLKPVTIEDDPK